MTLTFVLALSITTALIGTKNADAQQSADSRVADLVRAGKLRVGVGLGSPAIAVKDANSGEIRGPALDLGRALAAKIGVEFEAVYYPRPGAVLEGLKTGAWDVTFLVVDAGRAGDVDFAVPHFQSDFSYLVAADSPLRKVADVDRAGIRIAVPRGDASDLLLTRTLKHAELVRAQTIAEAVDLVSAGKANGYAAPRFVLLAESARRSGLRVLEDGFADIAMATMVPKGNASRVAYINEFIEGAKASGLISQSIERAGVKGIKVAPAADPAKR